MSLTSQASGGGAPPTLLGGLGEFEGLRLIYDDWRSRVYHFEALRTGTIGRTAPSHGVTRLAPTGVDLPQALLSLKSNDDPAWDQIVAIMQELVPDVGQLATPVEGTEVQIAFHDPFTGSRHNIKDLGTGVEQLLMTVYVGVRQPPGGIVVLEEPETNLHPAAQRTLLRYIGEWSKERLFIIATHSPVFLDGSVSGDRVVLVERIEGVATATEAGDDLRRVLLALGVHLSDVLSARAVLLVEGRSDADVLRAWFPSLTAAGGTAVAEMEGGDKAWGAELLATLVDAADQLERRIMVLRDRDELPDDAVEKLESEGLVHVLRNRELENYLLEAEAIRDVLDRQRDQHPQDRSETCSVDELEAILWSAADSLRDQIVLKRVVARLKSIRLVDRRDVQALCSEGPSVEALIDLVTARFRGVDEIRDEIQDLWREEAAAVNAAWEGHWRELAPGEELLKAVWTTHGGAFQKNRDGPLIAAAMSKPPDEIAAIVKAL